MPGAAVAATPAANAEPSSNWAGYAASGAQFSKVSGSWTQPTASCDSGSGDAAFWIGIGGASQGSNALEQTGTEVNCDTGTPTYSAWYELVPAAPVTIDMAVNPGDKISSTVGVDGNKVSIHLKNETTGKTFDKTLQMDNPDTSSAEWIAEAPSACQGGTSGNCQPVPLADFSSVDFTKASATADGQTGSISDFNATPMQLQPGMGGGFGGGQFGALRRRLHRQHLDRERGPVDPDERRRRLHRRLAGRRRPAGDHDARRRQRLRPGPRLRQDPAAGATPRPGATPAAGAATPAAA